MTEAAQGISLSDLQSQLKSGSGGQREDPANKQLGAADFERTIQAFAGLIPGVAQLTGLNVSGGEVATHKPLEADGLAGKTIPSIVSSLGGTGGAIWRMIVEALVKNGVITDMTAGVGGNVHLADLGTFSSPITPDSGGQMGAGAPTIG